MTDCIPWTEYEKAFGFLAGILNNPPCTAMVSQLREGFSRPPESLPAENVHEGDARMISYFQQHAGTPLENVAEELAVDWTRLFRGLSRQAGPQPPYEGVYCEKNGIGIATLLEVKQQYQKYGLSIPEGKNNREDYLGYELDFVRHLAAKAAAAQKAQKREEEEDYRTALSEFLNSHLNWTNDFCGRAADYTRTDFYSGFLILLQDTVSEAVASCS